MTFDNDTIAWSTGRGLGIYGDDDVVTNSHLVDNGMNGLSANRITGLDFEHNEIAYSNYEHWDITPTPYAQIAGAKLTGAAYTDDTRDNDFHDNYSNGLWFDELSHGQTIVANDIVRNRATGSPSRCRVSRPSSGTSSPTTVATVSRSPAPTTSPCGTTPASTTAGRRSACTRTHVTPPVSSPSDTSNVSIVDNVFEAGPNSQKYVFFNLDTRTRNTRRSRR